MIHFLLVQFKQINKGDNGYTTPPDFYNCWYKMPITFSVDWYSELVFQEKMNNLFLNMLYF